MFSRFYKLNFNILFLSLVVAHIVTYAFPTSLILQHNQVVKLLLSIAIVGLPIFFASACFAALFENRPASDAFGWNILGAVCGGLTEFLSPLVGNRNLVLLALVAYLIAYNSYLKKGKAQKLQSTSNVSLDGESDYSVKQQGAFE